MRQGIIVTLAFVLGFCLLIYFSTHYPLSEPWVNITVSLLLNMLATPIYLWIAKLLTNFHRVPLWFRTQVIYRKSYVRLSISYLFRIRVKGKYLLVRNGRGDYYQLVGGAYKTLPGAESVFDRYKVITDSRFETDHGIAKNDLRFRVPGRHVLAMLKWFDSRQNREISQWREFCEELLTTNILPKHPFRYIDYKYACTVQSHMQEAKQLQCQEILLFEIYDLVPNDEQQKLLEDLLDEGDTAEVKWADEVLIRSLGFDHRNKKEEYRIGPHTKWALNEQWSND